MNVLLKLAGLLFGGIAVGWAGAWLLDPLTWVRRRQLREVRKFHRWWM